MVSKIIKIIKKNFLYNRFISFTVVKMEAFVKKSAEQIKKQSKIIDIGAGTCPYKKYFKNISYISQDFCVNAENDWDFSHIDIKSDAHDIPVEDGSFDNILCISVLEHLAYPHKAIGEFSRILRSKGRIYLAAPLTWGEHHEPFDYFRYTKFGLRKMAEENNLKVISIKSQGGFFILLSQTITGFPHNYIRKKFLANTCFLILYPINFLIGFTCYFLDKIDKTKITVFYECI